MVFLSHLRVIVILKLFLFVLCSFELFFLEDYCFAESLTDQLQDLKKACSANLLSPKECEEKKKQILSNFGIARKSENKSAKSKKPNEPYFVCNYVNAALTGNSIDVSNAFSPSAPAQKVVKEILDEANIPPNFVVRPGPVPNAAAIVSGFDRYVLYNTEFMTQLQGAAGTNWAVYSVMAHEIAHHLQGHTLMPGGSRPDNELEADNWSGFMLAKLGATLEQAQVAMKSLGNDQGSPTHPPKAQRLSAIEFGWKKGVKGVKEAQPIVKKVEHLPTSDIQPNVPKCSDECPKAYERECIDEEEARICKRGADKCLSWVSESCRSGQKCSDGRCRKVTSEDPGQHDRPQQQPNIARACCNMFSGAPICGMSVPVPVGTQCSCLGLPGFGVACN